MPGHAVPLLACVLLLLHSPPASASTWTEQQQLAASDAASGDYFGTVSISGDYAVIGAPFDDSIQGSAYIFYRSGSSWTQQAKLVAGDGAANDYFGNSVSMSGDTVVIGAASKDSTSPSLSNSGSAYVFVRSGTSWTQEAQLVASDAADDDKFGTSVAISGDYIIVGAFVDDDNGSASGSAYVFMRTGTTWSEQAKLTASDGANGDNFGYSVSISGSYAVVGAEHDDTEQGSAYVFERTGSTWSQMQKLTASDAATNVDFGQSVSISGSSIIIGAPAHDGPSTLTNADYGRAYIFVSDGTTWTEQQKIVSNDNGQYDWFGWSVAISSDDALVGARFDDYDPGSGSIVNSGSAYVFTRPASPPPSTSPGPSTPPTATSGTHNRRFQALSLTALAVCVTLLV